MRCLSSACIARPPGKQAKLRAELRRGAAPCCPEFALLNSGTDRGAIKVHRLRTGWLQAVWNPRRLEPLPKKTLSLKIVGLYFFLSPPSGTVIETLPCVSPPAPWFVPCARTVVPLLVVCWMVRLTPGGWPPPACELDASTEVLPAHATLALNVTIARRSFFIVVLFPVLRAP
jgi:hypothetical protein